MSTNCLLVDCIFKGNRVRSWNVSGYVAFESAIYCDGNDCTVISINWFFFNFALMALFTSDYRAPLNPALVENIFLLWFFLMFL
jgi:hypothetical protein